MQIALLMLFFLGVASLQASERMAMVLTCQNAAESGLPSRSLVKSPSAIESPEGALKDCGYEVVEFPCARTISRADLLAAVERFSNAARNAREVVVYYPGSVLRSGGRLYFWPGDPPLDVNLWVAGRALDVGEVLAQLHAGGGDFSVTVIVDSSENNRFLGLLPSAANRSGSSNSSASPFLESDNERHPGVGLDRKGFNLDGRPEVDLFLEYPLKDWGDGNRLIYRNGSVSDVRDPSLSLRVWVDGAEEDVLNHWWIAPESTRVRERDWAAAVLALASAKGGEGLAGGAQGNAAALQARVGMGGRNAGDVYVNGVGGRLRWCPPGEFWMGSPGFEQQAVKPWLDASDELAHRVVFTRGFWMGEHEVTQGEWRVIMGRSLRDEVEAMLEETGQIDAERRRIREVREFIEGASGSAAENQIGVEGEGMPIYWVKWEQAAEYCRRLTERERSAGRLSEGARYALPTEAQWEYACRAGSRTSVYTGDVVILGKNNAPQLDTIGWYAGNSSVGYVGRGWAANLPEKQYPGGVAGPRLICSKTPNSWGLYDMIGNVAEWCADWYGPYPAALQLDPGGPERGEFRVFRGGGWSSSAAGCRAAFRNWNPAVTREYYVGFRPVLLD